MHEEKLKQIYLTFNDLDRMWGKYDENDNWISLKDLKDLKLKEMEKKTIIVNGEIWEETGKGGGTNVNYLILNKTQYKPQKKELTLDEIMVKYMSKAIPSVYVDDKHRRKLRAIRDMIIVADYVNEGWTPDWDDGYNKKYFIKVSTHNRYITHETAWRGSIAYFKSEAAAERAIKILGEDTIKLALS